MRLPFVGGFYPESHPASDELANCCWASQYAEEPHDHAVCEQSADGADPGELLSPKFGTELLVWAWACYGLAEASGSEVSGSMTF